MVKSVPRPPSTPGARTTCGPSSPLALAARPARAGLRRLAAPSAPGHGIPAAAPLPGALSPQDALSAQELQIAKLAAEGLSNREIGERLYLSPRTVGSHLYRIFRKLGIASRAQLSARLGQAWQAT
jgi:DNA-binding CsgD family transcriptional regulator